MGGSPQVRQAPQPLSFPPYAIRCPRSEQIPSEFVLRTNTCVGIPHALQQDSKQIANDGVILEIPQQQAALDLRVPPT